MIGEPPRSSPPTSAHGRARAYRRALCLLAAAAGLATVLPRRPLPLACPDGPAAAARAAAPLPASPAEAGGPGAGGDADEAPYGEFCEPRPRNEKQPWNRRKRVVSYSLFLPHDRRGSPVPGHYLDGLEANVRLAGLYYPEWIVRVYAVNLSEDQVRRVLAVDAATGNRTLEVVVCPDGSPLGAPLRPASGQYPQYRGAYGRFLAADDPKVELAVFRDLDSRPSVRELLAVNEWISSGLGVHTMHDHRFHHEPLLGGMWGARRGAVGVTGAMRSAVRDHPGDAIGGYGGDDQGFLATYVWPAVRGDALDHEVDPDRCRRRGARACRKFPATDLRDDHFFVGQPFQGTKDPFSGGEGTKTAHYECSVQCRPSHEEWFTDPSSSNM